MKKKISVFFLIMTLLVSMIPQVAFAAETDPAVTETPAATEVTLPEGNTTEPQVTDPNASTTPEGSDVPAEDATQDPGTAPATPTEGEGDVVPEGSTVPSEEAVEPSVEEIVPEEAPDDEILDPQEVKEFADGY